MRLAYKTETSVVLEVKMKPPRVTCDFDRP